MSTTTAGARAREQLSATAGRREPCTECRTWIERGDNIRRHNSLAIHLACWPDFMAKRRVAASQAAGELFWSVPCPQCGASALQGCQEDDGELRVHNHKERLRAYSEARREGLEPNPVKLATLRAARILSRRKSA